MYLEVLIVSWGSLKVSEVIPLVSLGVSGEHLDVPERDLWGPPRVLWRCPRGVSPRAPGVALSSPPSLGGHRTPKGPSQSPRPHGDIPA